MIPMTQPQYSTKHHLRVFQVSFINILWSINPCCFQDHLIQCLQLCTSKYSQWDTRREETEDNEAGGETPEVIEEAQDILQSMIERMAKSELEDFELDKSSDFSVASSVGQKNRAFARLVMGIYEVYVVCLSEKMVDRLQWFETKK